MSDEMTEGPQSARHVRPVLAYGVSYGMVLLPLDVLEEEARFAELLGSVDTVGDYVRIATDPDEPLAGSFPWWEDDELDMVPPDDTPFDLGMVPGSGDGYFPVSINTTMLSVLESAFLLEEGEGPLDGLYEYHDWMGGIPHIEIPAANCEVVVQRLSAAGYEVVERQDLVDRLWQ